MNRKDFIKAVGLGLAAAIVAPSVLAEAVETIPTIEWKAYVYRGPMSGKIMFEEVGDFRAVSTDAEMAFGPGKNFYRKHNKKGSHRRRMRQLQRPKTSYCPPMQVD